MNSVVKGIKDRSISVETLKTYPEIICNEISLHTISFPDWLEFKKLNKNNEIAKDLLARFQFQENS